MRTAQIIDFEAYRARRHDASRADSASAPMTAAPGISVVWVPIWYWLPVAFFCG